MVGIPSVLRDFCGFVRTGERLLSNNMTKPRREPRSKTSTGVFHLAQMCQMKHPHFTFLCKAGFAKKHFTRHEVTNFTCASASREAQISLR
ncbi:MAG: hypothetical protein IJU52_03205, partial [Clostridia bacterium]|nr:hypothetical protein [Clostridia bacterium]